MESIDAIKQAVAEIACRYPSIVAVYLFGSRSEGTARPDSDYDLAVLYRPGQEPEGIAEARISLQQQFEELFNRDVDVVFLHLADIEMRYKIITRGTVVYCADEEAGTDFVDMVFRDYLDFKPFLAQFRREVAEAIREGHFFG